MEFEILAKFRPASLVSVTMHAFLCFSSMITKLYPELLNTVLYQRWIKHSNAVDLMNDPFSWEAYYKFIIGSTIPEELLPTIAYRVIAVVIFLITALFFFYHVLRYFGYLRLSNIGPRTLQAITFYIFLILPFKNTHYAHFIRNIFASFLLKYGIKNILIIDELIFCMCIGLLYLSSFLAVYICNRCIWLNSAFDFAKLILRNMKIGFSVVAIFLYSLNMILSIDSIYFMMGVVFLVFAVVYYMKLRTNQSLYGMFKDKMKCIDSCLFPFIESLVYMCYFIIIVQFVYRGLDPGSNFQKNACYSLDFLFYNIFVQKPTFFSILLKIGILGLFILFIRNEEQNQKKFKHFTAGNSGINPRILKRACSIKPNLETITGSSTEDFDKDYSCEEKTERGDYDENTIPDLPSS